MAKAYIPKNNGADWWRDIPGYDGKYEVNRIGEVRRKYKSGLVRDMAAYKKSGRQFRDRLFVKLTKDGEKGKDVAILKIMVKTWFKEQDESKVPYHKNHIVTDNRVENIGFAERSKLGKETAHMAGRRKTVFKVNQEGEDVEVYRSAREAAKANNMSYQTVLDRCNGKVKNPYALDGYTYRFEEKKRGRKRRRNKHGSRMERAGCAE